MLALWGLSSEGANQERIAMQLGANRWYTLIRVIIPSMRIPLIVSTALCGLTSFDESVVVLFISDWRARTLPRQMFDSLRYDLSPTVAAAAVLTMTAWTILCILVVRNKHL